MKRSRIILGICFIFFGISSSDAQFIDKEKEMASIQRGDSQKKEAKSNDPGATSDAQSLDEKKNTKAIRRGDIKGPKAKNIEPSAYKAPTVVKVENVASQIEKGPNAKNQKVWKKDKNVEKVVVQKNKKRTQLKGPRAKNYKPWKDND